MLGWHLALVRSKWAAFGGTRGPGRPRIDEDCWRLILRLVSENPRWGNLRIRGELLKFDHVVSATSIRNLMQKYELPTVVPSPRRSRMSWREFLSPSVGDLGHRLLFGGYLVLTATLFAQRAA